MNKPTISIVEDEPIVLRVLTKLLGKHYEILTASSLGDARRLLDAAAGIELVIIDYLLSTATSLGFLNDLRKTHPSVKRILMSGKMDGEFIAGAIDSELADRVITKPWQPSELLSLVGELLSFEGIRV